MRRVRPVHILTHAEMAMHAALSVVADTPELIRAKRLKEKIERYWQTRGHRVAVTLAPIQVRDGRSGTRTDYCLQSDLVNGYPTGRGA